MYIIRAAMVASIALVLVHSEASARCFFLECEPGDTPAPAPRLEAAPPKAPAPQQPRAMRPERDGETCAPTGAYTYCVSSVLAPQYGFSYGPEKAFDGNLATAWVEGVAADGIGEWIVVDVSKPQAVAALQILNGYHKNEDIYRKNNRIRDIAIHTSNGVTQAVTLADSPELQVVDLDDHSPVQWIQVTIKSVYRGTKYRDTALSEFRLVPAP